LLQHGTRIPGVQRNDAQIDLRLLALKGVHQHGNEQGRGRIGHGQREVARIHARVEALGLEGLVQTIERGPDDGPQRIGTRSRCHAVRRRNKEFVMGRLAQAPQCVADRRLCHRKARRSARDVAFDHHDVEDSEQIQIQGPEVDGTRVHRGVARAFVAVMPGFGIGIGRI
jgi:hypothetical protein